MWMNIETATKGRAIDRRIGEKSARVFCPEWCFIHLNGKVFWTYMLENGRWNGLTKDQKPDLWHAAPVPPHGENR